MVLNMMTSHRTKLTQHRPSAMVLRDISSSFAIVYYHSPIFTVTVTYKHVYCIDTHTHIFFTRSAKSDTRENAAKVCIKLTTSVCLMHGHFLSGTLQKMFQYHS